MVDASSNYLGRLPVDILLLIVDTFQTGKRNAVEKVTVLKARLRYDVLLDVPLHVCSLLLVLNGGHVGRSINFVSKLEQRQWITQSQEDPETRCVNAR